MKQVISITMLLLAYSIILMHAVVPHHHHDCCGEVGIVFEDELTCTCDHHDACCHHHDGESHHPFDSCKLQDLLSQLVISNRDDKVLLMVPEAQASLLGLVAVFSHDFEFPLPALCFSTVRWCEAQERLPQRCGIAHLLRAPPAKKTLA